MSLRSKKTSSYTYQNRIRLLKGGAAYFEFLKQCIEGASHSIHVQMYIFGHDQTGIMIIEALMHAAARGVKVFLIADGYASQGIPRQLIHKMREAGIFFRYFEPLLRSHHFYFGRRLHEKLIVIDGNAAFVGGINIADRYNDIDGKPAWLDFALFIEGEAAKELYERCFEQWPDFPVNHLPVPYKNTFTDRDYFSVRVRINDWVKGRHQIWKTYFELFNKAQESITIICSYFLPGNVLRRQLKRAAKRGVKIKVILAGPSDVMLAKYAERYLYDWMLRNNIEIYEYQKTVLHAKMAVVDNHWLTIGSFNVNNISAYASVELNLDVRNKPFARSVQTTLDEIIAKDCLRITQTAWTAAVNLFKRFVQRSSYDIVRIVLNLSTFYFKEE